MGNRLRIVPTPLKLQAVLRSATSWAASARESLSHPSSMGCCVMAAVRRAVLRFCPLNVHLLMITC